MYFRSFKPVGLEHKNSILDLYCLSIQLDRVLNKTRKDEYKDAALLGFKLAQEALKEKHYQVAYYALKWTNRLLCVSAGELEQSDLDVDLINLAANRPDSGIIPSKTVNSFNLLTFFSGLEKIELSNGKIFLQSTGATGKPMATAARYLIRIREANMECSYIAREILNEIGRCDKVLSKYVNNHSTQMSAPSQFLPSAIPKERTSEVTDVYPELMAHAVNVLGENLDECSVITKEIIGADYLSFEGKFTSSFPVLAGLLNKSLVSEFETPDGNRWFIYQWYAENLGACEDVYWLCRAPVNKNSDNRRVEHNLLLRNFGGIHKMEGEFSIELEDVLFYGGEGTFTPELSQSFESFLDESLEQYFEKALATTDKEIDLDSKNWIRFDGIQSSDFTMYNLKHNGLIKFSFDQDRAEPVRRYKDYPDGPFYEYVETNSFVEWVEKFALLWFKNVQQGQSVRIF